MDALRTTSAEIRGEETKKSWARSRGWRRSSQAGVKDKAAKSARIEA
jgi:hypothetical protein